MKKILAAMLATAMVLSMSVSSFALIGQGAAPASSSVPKIGEGARPGVPVIPQDSPVPVVQGNPTVPVIPSIPSIPNIGDTLTGSQTFRAADVTKIYDADGNVIDWNETVTPGNAYYILLGDSTAFSEWATNSANARVSTKKIKNGSLIQSIGLVEKRLDNTRKSYLQVTFKDNASADEIRVDFSVTFTAKKDMTRATSIFNGSKFLLKRNETILLTSTLYVSNENVEGGDTTVSVGKTGAYVKPIGGETNEVIFEDSNDVIATLTFDAASNPSKFYAKVTTNWTTTTIKKFQNTDAVIRTFYPATVDSRSRARLALSNPYDTDRHDPTKVWIYSLDSKGVPTDISKSFKYNSDLDAYTTSIRTLGTYVISNVKISTK